RLRDAIEAVNQGFVPASPTPTITFAVDGTIMLNSGTLPVNMPVSIDATSPAHAIVVDGGCTTCDPGGNPSGGVVVFGVTGGTTAQPVTLAGLTVRHGYGVLGSGGGGINNSGTLHVTNSTVTANAAASNGGGIFNTGTLSVAGSMITNNSIYSSFRYGGTGIDNAISGTLTVTGSTITGNSGAPGAIQNEGESSTATVTNSTISGNNGGAFGGGGGGGLSNTGHLMTVVGSTISGNNGYIGGGINNFGVSLNVTDSTIAGNTASFRGGAIFAGGSGTVTLTNTTLSGNSAMDAGGGITAQTNATVALTNTIVANSTGGDLSVYSSAGGTFTGVNNLIDDAATAASFTDGASGNIVGHPALLGTLGNYGGPTQTVALLPGSPAIDAGASGGIPPMDQRGKNRVGAPDIGAFESQGFTLTPIAGSTPQSAVVNTPFTQPLALTVAANNAVEPVAGGMITFTAPASGPSAVIAGSPATIGAGGAASATAMANGTVGTYAVTASASGAANATFSLTNTVAPLVSIAVAPTPTTLKVGQVQQFTATGTYADNSTMDLTGQVTWGTDSAAVAVDAAGKGTAKAGGTAHVTATLSGVSGQATVMVSPPVLTGVQPAPAPAGRPSGASTTGPGSPTPAPTPAPLPTGR
ncbi:MAG TPA: choice-of-anchor Q domain-containing protein, partial [Thermomicrobiales bacterium]